MPHQDTRVAFYVNKQLDTSSWEVEFITADLAHLTITLTDDLRTRKIHIFNAYNPSPLSYGSVSGPSTLPTLRKACQSIRGEEIIVLGDFNLHHPLWAHSSCLHHHSAADTLLEIAQENFLDLATPKGITTWSARGFTSTIDLAFTTSDLLDAVLSCQVTQDIDQNSDHLPITLQIQLQTANQPLRPKRAWARTNQATFTRVLQDSQVFKNHNLQLATPQSIDLLVDQIYSVLQQAIDAAVPWKRPSTLSKGFWTQECSQDVQQARRLRLQLLSNFTDATDEDYKAAVKKKRNTVRKAKQRFFRLQIHEASNSTDGIWKLARWAKDKSLTPPPLPQFPDLQDFQGAVASTFEEKVELFKDTFFPAPPDADLTDINGAVYPTPYEDSPVITVKEVRAAIKAPNAFKAPGWTGIPHFVLQLALPTIETTITQLFQACVDIGYHPQAFKRAITVVLRKPQKESYAKPKSYRPIALLDTLGKALEKVLAQRLSNLAELHKLLPKYQMGARKGRDTIAALELIVEQTHTIWNSGHKHIASLLSLDMAGAFDNASHPRLLHILQRLGIPQWIIQWTASFLTDRKSTLTLNYDSSNVFAVRNGIPQGSPISPILFLFYNEELIRTCNATGEHASGTGFVDDVNILVWGDSTATNCSLLTRIHNRCQEWARRHGAQFAPHKYELMHLSRNPKQFDMSACLQFADLQLHPKTEIRILGLQIDPQLRWGPHIKRLQEKMARQMLALSRTTASTWGATFTKSRQVYTAVIRPALTYGSPVWHTPETLRHSRKTVNKKLQTIQNTGIRRVLGAYKATPTAVLEAEAGIPPIDLHIDSLQLKARQRLHSSGMTTLINQACSRIRSQLRGRRGRTRTHQRTPGQAKTTWAQEPQPVNTHTDPQQVPPSFKDPKKWLETKWKTRWKDYLANIPLDQRSPAQRLELHKKDLQIHNGLTKAESALATQIRTEKIGFADFLAARKVPGYSPECSCGFHRQTAKHVIFFCPDRTDRETITQVAGTADYHK